MRELRVKEERLVEFEKWLLQKEKELTAREQEIFRAAQYKTKMCRHWEQTGSCPYNEKCLFAHGPHEVRGMFAYASAVPLLPQGHLVSS